MRKKASSESERAPTEINPAAVAWYVEGGPAAAGGPAASGGVAENARRAARWFWRRWLARLGIDGEIAAGAIVISLYALFTGLGFTLISLGTLIFELI
jgi:hypothetical protein